MNVVEHEDTDVNHHAYRQKIKVKEDNFAGIRIYEDIVKNRHDTESWVEVYFKTSIYDGDELIDEFKFEKLFPTDCSGCFDIDIEPIADSAGKTYDLVIEPYYDHESKIPFALIKEESDAESTLTIDGTESEFKFAYSVKYYDNYGVAAFVLLVTCVVFIQIVGLFFLNKNKTVAGKYLAVALAAGAGLIIICPNYFGHDEVFQYGHVYDILNGHILPESERGWPEVKVRRDDYPFTYVLDDEIKEDGEAVQISRNYVYIDQEFSGVYPPIAYIPSLAGLSIARMVVPNNAIYWPYFMRFFQMIACVLISYYAIKITPIYKRSFAIIALIPVFMNAICFISSDSLLFCSILLLFAQVLEIIKSKQAISNKQFVILLLSSILVSLTKLVYIPMIFIMLVILLSRKVRGDKSRIFSIIGVSLVSTIIWNLFAVSVLTQGQGVNTWYLVGYYLRNPIELIQIISYTQFKYGWNHFSDLFGIYDSAFDTVIYDSTMMPMLFAGSAMLAFFNEKKSLNKKSKILAWLIMLATFILISLSLLVACTPVRFAEIKGIQGRYFLPLIPLVAMIASSSKFKVPEKIYEFLPYILLLSYFIYEMRLIVDYY